MPSRKKNLQAADLNALLKGLNEDGIFEKKQRTRMNNE